MKSHLAMLSDEVFCIAILDKDALAEEIRTHIAHCSACQEQLADYEQLHKHLLSSLYRRACPGSMQLSQYCAHMLPFDETARIAAHVQQCVLCASEVQDTRQFFKDIEGIR